MGNDLLVNGVLDDKLNMTNICLISRTESPWKISEF